RALSSAASDVYKRQSQPALICETILQQIERGLFATQSKRLPSERELSEIFNASRLTVKDALQQLEIQGIIYRKERRGWFLV
ncbi:GntR family transcriptional regulator, partial [Photobacterium phosphoreum]|uniref:GntR family transcriptional regulator n=1 Tax=Photobacterium phosphoreum TaxID=659 RepID=UPI001EFD2BF5